jgi:hypothetical protein
MLVPVTVICYCGFDGVFGEDTTMDFDWWEGEVFGDE